MDLYVLFCLASTRRVRCTNFAILILPFIVHLFFLKLRRVLPLLLSKKQKFVFILESGKLISCLQAAGRAVKARARKILDVKLGR